MRRALSAPFFALFACFVLAPAACGDSSSGSATTNTTAGSAGANTGGSGAAGTAGTAGTAGSMSGGSAGSGGGGSHPPVKCVNQYYQCGDGIDNDGDGKIDSDDPDCLAACDNTEDSYYGGIPGQPGPACTVDCYWDSNSGAGNDECYWNHSCDMNEQDNPGHPEPNAKCPYDPNANTPGTGNSCDELYKMQLPACTTFCGPLTPNGCDCFGCCELPAGSGKFVWLGSEDEATGLGSCSIAVIDDPTKCEPCLPVQGCFNGCDTCELCIGKDTLPPECTPGGSGGSGGGGQQCSDGTQQCGLPGQSPCPADFYCVTGCCQPIEQPK